MEETSVNRTTRILTASLTTLALALPLSALAASAVGTMAEIVSRLNHYPTDDDKKRLQDIVAAQDSAADVKAVASAILNLQHQTAAEDKTRLAAIQADEAASAELKALAGVVANLNHKPSAADLEVLAGLQE
jgi:hypothetical protein